MVCTALRSSLVCLRHLPLVAFGSFTNCNSYDIFALSDSVYTQPIIFAFAFLLLAFAQHKSLYFGLASGSYGQCYSCLATRHVLHGYLCFGVLLICSATDYERNAVVALALPLPIILLLPRVYNYMTLKQFVISPWGDVNIADATILFSPGNQITNLIWILMLYLLNYPRRYRKK